jgi:hypothetical protein
MSTWMAASMRKKAELAWSAFATDALPRPDHGTFIKSGITIVDTEHKVYHAYLSGPDSADLLQDTSTSTCAISILGNDTSVLHVARLCGNLMEDTADENTETGYWSTLLGSVLESLAYGMGKM